MLNFKPKTLLVIVPSLHIGGTETHLSEILPALKTKGWDITVFLTSGTGELLGKLEAKGIKICQPNYLTHKLHNKNKILRAPLLLLTFCKLMLYLIKNRPSIVQFMLTEAYLLGGLCCLLVGQKNLIMSRRSLNNYQSKYPILTKLELWLHTKMQYIITNSQANLKQLAAIEHVPINKLKLIYNGINLSKFTDINNIKSPAVRAKFNLPDSDLVLIVVANIIHYKGHATLLQALAMIKHQLPADWQLICLGKKHDYINELESLAKQLEISQHIYWLGTQAAIEEFMAISDIAISCSYEEGFSNAVLEAMAAGLPLIVTNVGGNPEAVIDQHTGIVVPARDANALGVAISSLAANPSHMVNMGAAGKLRVAQQFSLPACVDSYDKLYSGLLAL